MRSASICDDRCEDVIFSLRYIRKSSLFLESITRMNRSDISTHSWNHPTYIIYIFHLNLQYICIIRYNTISIYIGCTRFPSNIIEDFFRKNCIQPSQYTLRNYSSTRSDNNPSPLFHLFTRNIDKKRSIYWCCIQISNSIIICISILSAIYKSDHSWIISYFRDNIAWRIYKRSIRSTSSRSENSSTK